IDQERQCFFIVYQSIDPEFTGIVPGIDRVVDSCEVRADLKTMFYPSQREKEGAASMGKSYPEFGKFFENAREYHGTDRSGSFSRHAYQPGQPVFFHLLFTHHLPGMDKEGASDFFGGFIEWEKFFI